MKKYIIAVVVLLLMCTVCYAQNESLEIINNEDQICILASVSDVDLDNDLVTVNFSRVVGSDESPFEKNCELKIHLFSYSYPVGYDGYESYNTPMQGDNIFITLGNYNDEICEKNGVAYKVNTVENVEETLYVRAPEVLKGEKCMSEIIAYSYLIRSNGKSDVNVKDDEIIIKNDTEEVTVNLKDGPEKTFVLYFNENNQNVDDFQKPDVINAEDKSIDTLADNPQKSEHSKKRIIAFGLIGVGLLMGLIVVYISARKKKGRGI